MNGLVFYSWLCPHCLTPLYASQPPSVLLCELCAMTPEFHCEGYTLKIVPVMP